MKKTTLAQNVITGLTIVFFLVMLGYTSYRTYHLLALTSDSFLIPIMGLTLFDVGMLAWGAIFLYASEGLIQRSVAVVCAVIDLILVCSAVILDMVLEGQKLIDVPKWAGIAAFGVLSVAAIINVVGAFAYKLTAKGALDAMRKQSAEDYFEQQMEAEEEEVTTLALQQLTELRRTHSAQLAQQLSARMFARLQDRLDATSQYTMPPALMPHSTEIGAGGDIAQFNAEAPAAPKSSRPASQ